MELWGPHKYAFNPSETYVFSGPTLLLTLRMYQSNNAVLGTDVANGLVAEFGMEEIIGADYCIYSIIQYATYVYLYIQLVYYYIYLCLMVICSIYILYYIYCIII